MIKRCDYCGTRTNMTMAESCVSCSAPFPRPRLIGSEWIADRPTLKIIERLDQEEIERSRHCLCGRSLAAVALLLCLFVFPVTAQEARIVERLADGSFIVAIGSIEYRALPPARVAELAKQKIDLEASQKINAELETQIKEALLQRDLAQTQRDLEKQKAETWKADFERERENGKRNFELFQSERALRIEAMQFVPHGNKTKLDKVLAFFDRPETVSFFKIGLPLIQTWRCQ